LREAPCQEEKIQAGNRNRTFILSHDSLESGYAPSGLDDRQHHVELELG
jgi:hypothetical protein